MRAESCLRQPGDAARRESDGAVAVRRLDVTAEGDALSGSCVFMQPKRQPDYYTHVNSISGDDWQPLVTAERVEELEREVVRLKAEVQHWQANHDHQVGVKKRLTKQIATFTAELEKALKNGQTLSRYGLPPSDVSGKEAWTSAAGEIWVAARKLPTTAPPPPAEPTPEEAGEEKFPNPLQVTLGTGEVLISVFTDKDGAGLIFATGQGKHAVGEYDDGETVTDYQPQPGEVYIACHNRESAEVLLERVQTMLKEFPEPTPTPAPAKPEWQEKVLRKLDLLAGILGSAASSIADAKQHLESTRAAIPHPNNDPELAASLKQE